MPELVLQLTRAGFLALLWIFVLFSLRVVRSDLYGAAGNGKARNGNAITLSSDSTTATQNTLKPVGTAVYDTDPTNDISTDAFQLCVMPSLKFGRKAAGTVVCAGKT